MSDHAKSTPAPDPESRPDPETARPFREVFARRLPPCVRGDLERAARDAYHASLEANGGGYAFPDESDIAGQLAAAAVDLRATAELLGRVEREPIESSLDDLSEITLCLLAGPRRLEVEAVAEHIERMMAWKATPAQPFPPGCESAGMLPAASLASAG